MIYKLLKNKSLTVTGLLSFALILMSCTDLSENIEGELAADQFFQNEEEFISALGDAYGTMTGIHGGAYTQVNETTTDEVVVPTRGQDWFEDGFWYRVNTHRWTSDEFNGAWTFLFSGVNNSNRLIFQFQDAVDQGIADPSLAEPIISELEALRGFYYMGLLDIYGNVPIIDSFTDVSENPSQPSSDFQQGRQEVFNFVEESMLSALPDLSTNVGATYGRMNAYVAHMVLAKLYMNAEVYTGTARYADAIPHLDAIIESGEYSLMATYHDNFAVDNSGSTENMFVVPFDRVFLPGFSLNVMTLHYSSQATYNFQAQPWNGWSATQKMYETYIDSDKNPGPQDEVWGVQPVATEDGLDRIQGTIDSRTDNLIVGPQFSSSGERLVDDGEIHPFGEMNGDLITFTPAFNEIQFQACRQCGARIGKYEFEMGINTSMSNDFVIYRYSDVLLLKAEALWRQNSSDPVALALVNEVRNRAGVSDFTSLDADKILDERMREMFYEQTRRQDQIRFQGVEAATRYNDSWEFKDVSEEYRNVMPIPRVQLESNPNLVQNPGY